MPSHSSAWNKKNRDKINAYQRAYQERKRAKRSAMSPYQRVKEDLQKLLEALPRSRDRRRLLNWALKELDR